ncbi:hypothetical protein GOBAR_DD29835 [Gossypium barbadense]|nr:hypothetical protein GOBAR_DD29835 [Gossypium barbadense]
MTSELLEIHPLELKFTFELKKQSSCLIQLTNKTDQYVAFKVKTTSPKKYCVRPNTGIVKPKSTYDFTVTMQAQRVAPPDLICKDKFLIQSTVIPFGTAEEDITSDRFSKESGKHIEEKKLKVFLTSPSNSPVLTAINGDLKQDIGHETSSPRDKARHGVENIPPSQKDLSSWRLLDEFIVPALILRLMEFYQTELKFWLKRFYCGILESFFINETVSVQLGHIRLESSQANQGKATDMNIDSCFQLLFPSQGIGIHGRCKGTTMGTQQFKTSRDETEELTTASDLQSSVAKDVQQLKSAKADDFENLKSKISFMDSKLKEAEVTIMKLTQERSMVAREKDKLQSELELLKTKSNAIRITQVGFPLLYVCMVAVVGLVIEYLSNL